VYVNIKTCRIFVLSKQLSGEKHKNIMKTLAQLREELKDELQNCSYTNDGSLAAQVNENIQWAWENWEHDGDKTNNYTPEFRNDWIDNEPFDTELEQTNQS